MANLNDFASRFRKGLPSANPFQTCGLEWCRRCQMEVDTETHGHHQGTTYAYRRSCLRCGLPLSRGVYDNVVLIGSGGASDAAVQWTLERGDDRR